jgi:chloramphenicol 3-O phosphotransferase
MPPPRSEGRWPSVIVVNGPSSAGKSTLARGLQSRVDHPYLVTGFDDFIFMSAPRYYRGADTGRQDEWDAFTGQGVEMVVTTSRGGSPVATARFGAVFQRILDGMAPAVRALVDQGNDVIFDHVLHDAAAQGSMVAAFAGLDVLMVGVTCDVAILEERERIRGDRVLGRARGLAQVVHGFCDYDVMVDTGAQDPDACVSAVLDALATRHAPA